MDTTRDKSGSYHITKRFSRASKKDCVTIVYSNSVGVDFTDCLQLPGGMSKPKPQSFSCSTDARKTDL